MDVLALDGRAYAKFMTAGAYFLRKYQGVLNDLNVFPVPDGDTGTNMYLTARQAAIEAGKIHDARLCEVAAAAAHGALMGARGNSGVIVSQMLRGFAHHVRHRSEIDTFMLATAMREAAGAARQALVKPLEGTILSVADAAADSAYRQALHEPDLYRFLNGVLRSANEALDRTPDQLPALKEAGVVDSGGAGFIYFLEGVLRFLPDTRARTTAFPRRRARASVFTAQQAVGPHKYCTEFILAQAACSNHELRELLKGKGDSLIVAGEAPSIKVHIHTDNPEIVQAAAAKHGELLRLKVENMEQQHNVLIVDRPAAYSVAFVVPGAGFDQIARELGAEVTVPAQTNPSVRDLVLAINACLCDTVYLFANDKNVVLAAQEAARLSGRDVLVIATADIVAGLAGLLNVRQGGERQPDEAAILGAASLGKSAHVFFAGKDASVGGTSVQRGKPAAAYGGVLYPGETVGQAAAAALRAMGASSGGLITVYYGGLQKERDAQRLVVDLRAAFPAADGEYYYGGQKNAEYWMSLDD
ncbi:MAG: DAK2 domain-containing protein [Candidatus Baltobacteraceae bacterium]